MNVRRFPAARYAAVILAVAVAVAGCEVNLNTEGVVSRETRTFKVSGTPDVQLETFDGSIEVHSWDRPEVEVEIEKRASEQALLDDMKISAEQEGDRVVFKVSGPARQKFDGIQIGVHVRPTARLRVAVPRQTELAATSRDGSISVEDLNGKITLNTNDGSVRASRLSGEIVARSGDGAIRMDRVEGKLDLETEDGSIGLEAKPTALRAHTSDGSIRLQIEPQSVMAADWDVQTADGSVVLRLPSDFNAQLDAETRDGSVRANHPGISSDNETREGESRRERRRTLKTTLGTGGRLLRVRTGDGSIRIES